MTAPVRTALLMVGITWAWIAACLIILKNEPASPVLAPASSSRPPAPMAPSSVAVELDVLPAPPAAPSTSSPPAWAVAGVQADRLDMVAVGVPPVPPVPAGDCDAWADVFRAYGATADEVAFFVPRILERESGCGRDTLNDRTGDTGVCQVNPIHNRAGWFGGVEFGAGGWLYALHGLTTRQDTDSPRWAEACLTLYRVCGSGAWRPPYSCDNNSISKGK